MENRYPSFMEQLQEDMNKNPQKYVQGYDAYQMHQASNLGLHIQDPTRHVNLMRDIEEDSQKRYYYRQYRERMMLREQESRLAAKRRAEVKKQEMKEEMKKYPFKFFTPIHIVCGIDQIFKNILKKSAK